MKEIKRKRIGILTFHRANNYGALLQAYALKNTIQIIGARAEIVNYLCAKIEKGYSFFSGVFGVTWLIKKMIKIIFLPRIILNNNKFKQFRSKYLSDTLCLTPANIDSINDKYDVFVAGSDQVFNPRITNFDSNYLLNFVKDNKKKYSYAASLGISKINETEKDFLTNNLKTFAEISVREKQAACVIQSLINKGVSVHLDPTFLLNKTTWQNLAASHIKKEKFILLYLMNINEKIISFAQNLSKKTGLDVVYISNTFINKTPFKSVCVTPQEWLRYFLDAEYIITNSFHGLAFSINFNKRFYIDLLPPNWPVNSRIENLLDLTGLRDCLIDNIKSNYKIQINWEKVNSIIEQERQKSIRYLRGICE